MIVEAGGGVARHITDLCIGLSHKGIDVQLIYSPGRMDAVLASGLKSLSKFGVPVTAVKMHKQPSLSDIAALWKIRQYVKRYGPFDVIHGHSSKGGGLARLLFGVGPAKKIYSAHAFVTMNPNLSKWKYLFYSTVERFLSFLGDAVVTTSPIEHAHAIAGLHIPPAKIHLIPNGIDVNRAATNNCRCRLRRAWSVSEDEILVGSIARFVEQKSLSTLIRAIALVAEANIRVRLVLIGDGPLKSQLQQEVADLGISHLVVWPGYFDEQRAASALDVFALSSLYEGFPYVLLNALAAGLPVVSTRVGGAEMVVDDGKNGFVVAPGSVREIAVALQVLCNDKKKRKRMGQASRLKVQEFSVSEMVDKISGTYHRLVSPDLPK